MKPNESESYREIIMACISSLARNIIAGIYHITISEVFGHQGGSKRKINLARMVCRNKHFDIAQEPLSRLSRPARINVARNYRH